MRRKAQPPIAHNDGSSRGVSGRWVDDAGATCRGMADTAAATLAAGASSCQAGDVVVSVLGSGPDTVASSSSGVRARRRERRRLVALDRRSALRAESALLPALLLHASDLVSVGWAQQCWFVARGDDGRVRVGPRNLADLVGRQVVEVCLVGAVVQAAGGVTHAGSQPVQRALDVTWAALYLDPVRWCPAPAVRLAHVRDLTRWNDRAGRTAAEVSGLLALAADRSRDLAMDEICGAEPVR